MYTDPFESPFDRQKGQILTSPLSPELPVSSKYRERFRAASSNRAADLLRHGKSTEGCISLAQGEGTLKTPDFICHAAAEALENGKTFYMPPSGIPELRQEISTYYSREYGVTVPTNRITVTSSGTAAVHNALLAILEDGDEVVGVTPIWKNLIGIIELAGGTISEFPMTETEEGWALDLDGLFESCTSATKALLIVTPNNPTGWTMSSRDIKRVTEFARDRGLWIIADEVYGRCLHDASRAPSFLDHALEDDRLFVVNSFSKTWAMTGWRLGWLVGPADAEKRLHDMILYEMMGTPSFIQLAGATALRHGEEFLGQQKDLWRSNLDMVMECFSRIPRIKMTRPVSAFYAFFRVEGCDDSYELARQLIDEAGVSLAPGGSFGKEFNGHLRLCFASSPEILSEALGRLEKYLNT